MDNFPVSLKFNFMIGLPANITLTHHRLRVNLLHVPQNIIFGVLLLADFALCFLGLLAGFFTFISYFRTLIFAEILAILSITGSLWIFLGLVSKPFWHHLLKIILIVPLKSGYRNGSGVMPLIFYICVFFHKFLNHIFNNWYR